MTKEEIYNLFINESLLDFLDILKDNKLIDNDITKKILEETDFFNDNFDTSKSSTLTKLLDTLL